MIDTDPSPACGAAPLTVTFTGDDLNNSIGDTYAWTIAGASVGSSRVMTHTFAVPGQYVVRLVIANGAGSDSAQVTVNVPC